MQPILLLSQGLQLFPPLSTAAPTGRFSQQPEAVQKQIMVEVLCPWLFPKSPKSHWTEKGVMKRLLGREAGMTADAV